jgi:diazepam-binding inhibitor (GABA receptor modulating acyl-CoA-binding protein)
MCRMCGTLSTIPTVAMEAQFKKAVHYVRNGPPNPNSTQEEKLEVYSLYKQATEGDVTGGQPWAVQLEARAKVRNTSACVT